MRMNHYQRKNQPNTLDKIAGKHFSARAFQRRNKWLKFYIQLVCEPSAVLTGDPFHKQIALAL
jgi:hypothetical protein